MPVCAAVSNDQWSASNRWVTKTLRIMRLTAFLLMMTALHVGATAYSQKVTLAGKNIPIDKVLRMISQQTGYEFVYDPALVENLPVITIDVKDVPLEEALDLCFRGKGFKYTFKNNTIIVKELPAAVTLTVDPNVAPMLPPLIHGRVTDSAGKPLSGATVMVKGSKKGTETDANGIFMLKDVGDNATLVISFTGCMPREVKVNGRDEIVVHMTVSTSPLDKVQVIAYGSTTQRYTTGSVTTVTSKEIEQQPVSDPLQALEGRVPGLFITQSNGIPGSGMKVRIEGQNSLANGNEPLYVIDGVPYNTLTLPNIGYVLGGNGSNSGDASPLSFINPADIESISVLKDADATAIYGSRAANGAILITTRKGEAGRVTINASLQNGRSRITRELPLLNTKQYLEMRREAFRNDGLTPGPGDYDLNGAWDTTRYTDWQKVLIGRGTQYTTATVSASGGNASTQYFISGTYQKQTASFPGTFPDKKGSIDFNINSTSANQKFHLQLSGNYLVDDNQLPIQDLTTNLTQTMAPNSPALYKPDGSINWALDSNGNATFPYNPIAMLQVRDKRTTNSLISHAVLSYQIFRGLEFRSSFGYTNQHGSEIQTSPITVVPPAVQPYATRSASYGSNNSNSWIIEPQLNFKRSFGWGRLDVLTGATFQKNSLYGFSVNGSGYNSDAILNDLNAAAQVSPGYTSASTYRYNAIFGRVNYIMGDKYIVDLNLRRDGSSRFGSANLFHDFGSVGLGWIFSSEGFIRDHLSFLSFGKLTGSYGTTGNDQIGDYQFLTLYYPTYQDRPYQGATGLVPGGLSNPYLEWESTHKLYVSMDLGFLKDRILLTTGYVNNQSSNQLMGYSLPSIDGFGSVLRNFPATVENTSIEFTLKTTNIKTKDFSWTTHVNLTIPNNKLKSFPNLVTSGYAAQYVLGKSINLSHVYHLIGVDPATGVYQFMGLDGKPTFTPDPSKDQYVVISKDPKFYGGIDNTFRYKGVELSVFFQFVKQTGYAYPFGVIPGYFGAGVNQPTYVLKRWQKPGDIAPVMKFSTYEGGSIITSFFDAQASDGSYSDASYIRLKTMSLSWELPEKATKKAMLQSCQFFAHAQNLLTITKFKGFDPENQSTGSTPPQRTITVGIRLGL